MFDLAANRKSIEAISASTVEGAILGTRVNIDLHEPVCLDYIGVEIETRPFSFHNGKPSTDDVQTSDRFSIDTVISSTIKLVSLRPVSQDASVCLIWAIIQIVWYKFGVLVQLRGQGRVM